MKWWHRLKRLLARARKAKPTPIPIAGVVRDRVFYTNVRLNPDREECLAYLELLESTHGRTLAYMEAVRFLNDELLPHSEYHDPNPLYQDFDGLRRWLEPYRPDLYPSVMDAKECPHG